MIIIFYTDIVLVSLFAAELSPPMPFNMAVNVKLHLSLDSHSSPRSRRCPSFGGL